MAEPQIQQKPILLSQEVEKTHRVVNLFERSFNIEKLYPKSPWNAMGNPEPEINTCERAYKQTITTSIRVKRVFINNLYFPSLPHRENQSL